MDSATAVLMAAGQRQAKIDALIAEKQGQLDKLTKGAQKKRGRPNAALASRKATLNGAILRLQRGLLPDERDPAHTTPRTEDELRASAAQHPQHHAAAGVAPAGRAAICQPEARVGGAADAGGGARGGQGADGAARDARDDAGDDEDDVPDAAFQQYYAVSHAQKDFNTRVARDYLKGDRDRKEIKVEPPELLASGCKSACIGLLHYRSNKKRMEEKRLAPKAQSASLSGVGAPPERHFATAPPGPPPYA